METIDDAFGLPDFGWCGEAPDVSDPYEKSGIGLKEGV
jgi:hypothetical protein